MEKIEKKEFKKTFNDIANSRAFISLSKFWYIESGESILTLELYKSNFGDLYYLDIKIFIKNISGKNFIINKELGKSWPDVSRQQPSEYDLFFDFDTPLNPAERRKGLESLFDNFLIPFSKKALSLQGIHELANDGKIVIISSKTKNQLDSLMAVKKVKIDPMTSS